VDLFDKLNIDKTPLGKYAEQAHGYFLFPKLEGEIAPRMKFRGKEVLTWSLNNYLGLANHPEVREADAQAAKDWGLGYPMGARMMSGQTKYHEQLEQELATFVGKEAGYLLNFGYQGMLSIIDSILDRKDVVVYDAEAHACIIDGLRLHIGKRFVYAHNDIQRCELMIQRAQQITKETGGCILVITEGVYGMSGDLGKLDEIIKLKEKYDFRLLVDDAHGFGTMGKTGAGTGEHFNVQDGIDIYFATFAKSMASIGAFVASDQKVITYLAYNMRSQIFAKSLPMPLVIGALKRLELLKTKPELKEKLWTIVNALQKGLRESGFNIGNTNSPVTPVVLSGEVDEATNLTYDLRTNHNIFCSLVTYPVIPKGMIIIRLIPTAVHSLEDVDYTIKAFNAIRDKLTSGYYKTGKIADINN